MPETAKTRPTGGFVVLAVVLLILGLVGVVHLLAEETQTVLLVEGGVFETLSVVGYAACLVLIWFRWPWDEIRRRWYIVALIAMFAARELDLDKSLFSVGFLKSRQYVGDMVALPERAISFVLLALVLAVLVSLAVKETKGFVAGIRAQRPSEWAVFVGLVLMIASKSADGLGRKLADVGMQISKPAEQFAYVFEEVGELGITLMFATAIILSRSAGR